MMMQDKKKIIDLTKTATFGKNKKYDYPFHPDSEEYWFFEVSNDDKLRILLEKFNQNEGYFRSHSIEHLIETIFNSSNGYFLKLKRESEKYLELIPNRREQFIDDEKLKVFNQNKECKKILGGSEPSEDCFLDFEQSKEVFMEYTFPSLVLKSVSEISDYIKLLILYRCNLLYIDYLKNLSVPNQVEENKTLDDRKAKKRPSIRAIALYYYFLITKGIELSFDDSEEKKTKAIKGITDDWNIDNRTFREEWGVVNESRTRKNTKYIKDYRQAIQLLEKNINRNNDAIALAKSELRILAPLG